MRLYTGYCYAKQQQEIAEGKQKELNELKEKHDHLLQKLSDKDTEIRSLERTVERLKFVNFKNTIHQLSTSSFY